MLLQKLSPIMTLYLIGSNKCLILNFNVQNHTDTQYFMIHLEKSKNPRAVADSPSFSSFSHPLSVSLDLGVALQICLQMSGDPSIPGQPPPPNNMQPPPNQDPNFVTSADQNAQQFNNMNGMAPPPSDQMVSKDKQTNKQTAENTSLFLQDQ